MKKRLFCLFVLALAAFPALAQQAQPARSARKALGLSLLVPGLGHRYAHGGDWDGAASAFAVADAALWLGLVGTQVHRGDLIQSYETLAAARAGADVAGKDRRFFLNLASYRTSDDYREAQLRNRAWDQVDYVADRSYQWAWQSEEDFQQFRALREDAESLRRRRPFLVAGLVANRLLAGITAVRAAGRAAGRAGAAPSVSVSVAPPPPEGTAPVLHLGVRF